MAEHFEPSEEQIEGIKKAMVSAGFLKATSLSAEDHKKLEEALAKEGVSVAAKPYKIICSRAHWCLVIAR